MRTVSWPAYMRCYAGRFDGPSGFAVRAGYEVVTAR